MITKRKLGQCQVEGCYNAAKYGIFRTQPDGRKEWINVCPFHEIQIAGENIRRAGGYYEKGGKK